MIVSDIAPNEKPNMKPTHVLHVQEDCESSLRTKRESLVAGISRYRKEDKMSIQFLVSHMNIISRRTLDVSLLSIIAS